jgi:hypothetical protein
MMINCCPQILEIAPGAAVATPAPNVATTTYPIDRRKHRGSPPNVQALNALIKGLLVLLAVPLVIDIDRQHVGDGNLLNITLLADRCVFGR